MSLREKYLSTVIYMNEDPIRNFLHTLPGFDHFRNSFGVEGERLATYICTSFGMRVGDDELRNEYLKRRIQDKSIKVRALTIQDKSHDRSVVQLPVYTLNNELLLRQAQREDSRSGDFHFYLRPPDLHYGGYYTSLHLVPHPFAKDLIEFSYETIHKKRLTLEDLYDHLVYAMIESSLMAVDTTGVSLSQLSRNGTEDFFVTRQGMSIIT